MHFRRQGRLLFTATVNEHNAAFLDGHVIFNNSAFLSAVSTCPLDITLWHRRLGHLHVSAVQDLVKRELVTGISLQSSASPDPICEPCLAGKQHRGPIPKKASHHATHLLELVHSDLHGPLPVRTREGFQYWITFIDDFSKFFTVIPLHQKSDAFEAFKRFKAFAENQLNCTIKRLRDDKGGEYMSTAFSSFLAAAGIAREHTVRNEPHQNGVAERANRTLAEGTTALLQESQLPASFWLHALSCFVHVHNRSPTSALSDSTAKTPYELWYKSKPDISHLRMFSCTAYVHVQKDQRRQLQSYSAKCVFIGYPTQYKGWLF